MKPPSSVSPLVSSGCRLLIKLGVVFVGVSLGREAADRAVDHSNDSRFDPVHVFDIRIEMKPEAWTALREQAYDFALYRDEEWIHNIPPRPYTHFMADVTIDGTKIESVGVRKKGFLGSVNTVRPSLKLKFDEFVDNQEFLGTSRFTLQNNHTDRALVTQALASHVYSLAGVPAPRCNFARVTVNGEYLGVYTHIESIKKPFLRRVFGDDDGNLYEGRLSDFRPKLVETFEKKTNKKLNDRSDLAAVVKALESDDESLVEEVGKVVDIDRFIDFWTVTSLIQFWDSYPGSANNFYCYNNPASGKFEFIPWAPDSAFRDGWFALEARPKSVYADGYLALRLYGIPEIRQRYRERMRELLEGVWKEDRVLAEVQRMVALLAPHSHLPEEAWNQELDTLRERIKSRRAEITTELDRPSQRWPYPPQPELSWIDIGDVTCNFAFFKSPNPGLGKAELIVEMNGRKEAFTDIQLTVVPQHDGLGSWILHILGSQDANGGMGVYLPVPEKYFSHAGPVPLNGNDLTSWLIKFERLPDSPRLKMNAYGLNWGTVEFEEIESADGSMIKGMMRSDVLKIPIH